MIVLTIYGDTSLDQILSPFIKVYFAVSVGVSVFQHVVQVQHTVLFSVDLAQRFSISLSTRKRNMRNIKNSQTVFNLKRHSF